MPLQWLGINDFSMIGDLQRFLLYLHECLQRLSLGQNNWPIACNKWFHHDCGWREPWALDSRHHSWPSLSQKVWYCDRKGPWFQHKSGRQKHSRTWSAGSECYRLDKSGIIIVRTCKVSFSSRGNTTDKTLLATWMSPMAVTRPEQLANFL